MNPNLRRNMKININFIVREAVIKDKTQVIFVAESNKRLS